VPARTSLARTVTKMPHVDRRRTINVHSDVITMESDSCSNDRHGEVCGLVHWNRWG